MEYEPQEPINSIEIEGRLIEPDMLTNEQEGINRNLQLGNIPVKDLYRLQALEEHSMILGRVPKCLGGDIFKKWADDTRVKKHHFLVLSGSREGFVRRMSRTSIQEASMEQKQKGIFKGLMGPKRNQ